MILLFETFAFILLVTLTYMISYCLGKSDYKIPSTELAYSEYVKRTNKILPSFIYRQLNDFELETYKVDPITQTLICEIKPVQMYNHGTIINENKNGFSITGIDEPFLCPKGLFWENNSCRREILCADGNMQPQPLFNDLNQQHRRRYITCNSHNPDDFTIKHCNEHETFNGTRCVVYDICKNNPNYYRHIFPVNDEKLKSNQYFECFNGASVIRECSKGKTFNVDRNTCIPTEKNSKCNDQVDNATFTIDLFNYVVCKNGMETKINCKYGFRIDEESGNYTCIECVPTIKYTQYFSNEYINITTAAMKCENGLLSEIESRYSVKIIEKIMNGLNVYTDKIQYPSHYIVYDMDTKLPKRVTVESVYDIAQYFKKSSTTIDYEKYLPPREYDFIMDQPVEKYNFTLSSDPNTGAFKQKNKPVFYIIPNLLLFWSSDIIYQLGSSCRVKSFLFNHYPAYFWVLDTSEKPYEKPQPIFTVHTCTKNDDETHTLSIIGTDLNISDVIAPDKFINYEYIEYDGNKIWKKFLPRLELYPNANLWFFSNIKINRYFTTEPCLPYWLTCLHFDGPASNVIPHLKFKSDAIKNDLCNNHLELLIEYNAGSDLSRFVHTN